MRISDGSSDVCSSVLFIWRPGLASAHLHCTHATMHAVADPSALQARRQRWSALWPGLALAAAVAATEILAARLPSSEERRIGKVCVHQWERRWAAGHTK